MLFSQDNPAASYGGVSFTSNTLKVQEESLTEGIALTSNSVLG
jgi:hypothetical protein